MNKEIKEILDNFIKYKDEWFSCKYILKPKQCVMLLDYITNLEQENEDLKDYLDIFKLSNKTKQETIDDFRKRVDKAIKYVEKSKLNQLETNCKYLCIDYDTGNIEHLDELLNILQRGDKE